MAFFTGGSKYFLKDDPSYSIKIIRYLIALTLLGFAMFFVIDAIDDDLTQRNLLNIGGTIGLAIGVAGFLGLIYFSLYRIADTTEPTRLRKILTTAAVDCRLPHITLFQSGEPQNIVAITSVPTP